MEASAFPDSGLSDQEEKGASLSSPFRMHLCGMRYSDPGPTVLFSVREIIAAL
jgi:hypothetical protein